jgi:ankyrin repeat protein
MAMGTRVLALVAVTLVAWNGADAAGGDLRLVEAAKNQNWPLVASLLKQKVDVNAPQPDGATALHWAVYWDDAGAIDALIAAGAKVNAANEFGATPLWIASTEGRARTIERLLRAGADARMALLTGETPLMTASRVGNVESVKLLLASGADVNARERSRDQTALMWAVSQQHADIVQVLLEHGADAGARSGIRRMLVNAGADGLQRLTGDYTDFIDEAQGGYTPLLFAARVGDLASARLLIDRGARVNDEAPTGASALHIAILSGQSHVAAFLLDSGADPDSATGGYTPLHTAVLRGDHALVKKLLEKGANPNALLTGSTPVRRNSQDWALHPSWIGATPMWLASRFTEAELMRVLAAAGADSRFVKKDGTTVLMAALAPGPGRRTSIQAAPPDPKVVERQVLEAVRTAADLGADVNTANAAGDSPLHVAAARRFDSVVQLLAERGANLGAKNKKGQTPLGVAAAAVQRRPADPAYGEQQRPSSTAELLRKLGAPE